MIKKLICKIGIHFYKFAWGSHNRYHECKCCHKRNVMLGRGGYQPVNGKWLDHEI